MKPSAIGVFGICLAAMCGGCGPSEVFVSPRQVFEPKMRIAVLDFDWSPPTGTVNPGHTVQSAPNAGKYVADSLSSHLLQMDCFEVLERSRIAQLLREKDLTQADVVSRGMYKEVGQFLGVDYLVLGTVNTYTAWARGEFHGHIVSFTSRCVDVRSSKVVWTLGGRADIGPLGPLDPARGLALILNDAIPKLRSGLKAHQRAN